MKLSSSNPTSWSKYLHCGRYMKQPHRGANGLKNVVNNRYSSVRKNGWNGRDFSMGNLFYSPIVLCRKTMDSPLTLS